MRLDQRSEFINYHCIMLWSSLVRIIWADNLKLAKYNFYDDQNHWCLLMVINNKPWLLSEKSLPSLLAHFYYKIIDSLLDTNELSALRPISNAWENSKLFPFWKKFKNLNLPAFIKEGMVSIMHYLFEKLCLHVKLVIYTMNIFHESWKYTDCPPNT